MSQLPTQIIPCNLVVTGTLTPTGLNAPSGSITPASISTPAAGAAGIVGSKLNHRQHVRYNQPEGTAVVSERRIVFITYGTSGMIIAANAALKVANAGAATITVDILKNGTSILSSVITLNSSSAIMTAIAAALATVTTAFGDVFEFNITATAGGGTVGQGLYVELILDETPS